MTKDKFYKKFKGVNTPPCRGAKMPDFNPAMVNEEKFSDALRFKSYDFNFIEGSDGDPDVVEITWVSQDWDDYESFVNEITRCMKHIGFTGDIHLDLYMRGEKGNPECSEYIEWSIF